MAEIPKITVAIESVVHQTFLDVAQRIAAEHGIIVDRVELSWIDRTTFGNPMSCTVRQVEVISRTMPEYPSRQSKGRS